MNTTFSGTNMDMVYSALLKYGVPTLLVLITFCLLLHILKKNKKILYRIIAVSFLVCLIILDAGSAYAFNKKTKVISDYYNSVLKNDDSDFIRNIYVDPRDVSIEFPEKKRNLIY